jgi:hypothetical protein
MKNRILFFVIIIIGFSSCKKDENNPSPNTPYICITAKINGTSFTDDGTVEANKLGSVLTSIVAIDTSALNSIVLSFGYTDTGTYAISAENVGAIYRIYDENGNETNCFAEEGVILITKYDLTSKLLSGSFYLKVRNPTSGSLIDITEGVITDIPIVE